MASDDDDILNLEREALMRVIDNNVGQRIKARRIELGLSQQKLGSALGLTFQQVQKYERGTNRVGASRLWAIASELRTDANYFFLPLPIAPTHASQNVMQGFSETQQSLDPPGESTPVLNTRQIADLVRMFDLIAKKRGRKAALEYLRVLLRMHDAD